MTVPKAALVEAGGGLLGGLLFCVGLSWVVSRQLARAERINA